MVLATDIVKYTPVLDSVIDKKVKQLTPEEIQSVNSILDVDQGVDGNKDDFSTLEKRLYASVAYNNSAQTILDGIYFYEINLLIGGNKSREQYGSGLHTFIEYGKASYKLTVAQVKGAQSKAEYDYLFKYDPNAAQLIKDLSKSKIKGDAYVQAIWQCWQNPSLESRNKVLELAKALVPKKPPFPSATYSALVNLCEKPLDDDALYMALTNVLAAYNSMQDHNAVQLE